MQFNERLVQIRKQQGMSQETLAERIGVSRQAVSKWETGEALPDYGKLIALADTLNVSLDFLCGRSEQTAAEPTSSSSVVEPSSVKKRSAPRILVIVLAALLALLILLTVGLLLSASVYSGNIATNGTLSIEATHDYNIDMPDTFTVSGVTFSCSNNTLRYSFVPSVAGEGYTYQISFRNENTGTEHTFDVPLGDASCYGVTTKLNSAFTYSVTAIISNGIESYMTPIATGLSFSNGRTTWTPAE